MSRLSYWKPSAASCTFRIARPEISWLLAQLGSQHTASGVEHAMLKPCKADLGIQAQHTALRKNNMPQNSLNILLYLLYAEKQIKTQLRSGVCSAETPQFKTRFPWLSELQQLQLAVCQPRYLSHGTSLAHVKALIAARSFQRTIKCAIKLDRTTGQCMIAYIEYSS